MAHASRLGQCCTIYIKFLTWDSNPSIDSNQMICNWVHQLSAYDFLQSAILTCIKAFNLHGAQYAKISSLTTSISTFSSNAVLEASEHFRTISSLNLLLSSSFHWGFVWTVDTEDFVSEALLPDFVRGSPDIPVPALVSSKISVSDISTGNLEKEPVTIDHK